MAQQDEFVTRQIEMVFTSIDPIRVRMARDLLDAAGIEAFIFDGETSRMLGSTVAVACRLMVYSDCAEEAREQLRKLGFES